MPSQLAELCRWNETVELCVDRGLSQQQQGLPDVPSNQHETMIGGRRLSVARSVGWQRMISNIN
ncbi:hypothetical protein HJC23_002175 [Cyclotella cryptica]|uniref:Uncharacterized protein n=1 Tax=Cyclotella cryptica TaxID=29204 RepID=A0ABD3Q7D2_9STRA